MAYYAWQIFAYTGGTQQDCCSLIYLTRDMFDLTDVIDILPLAAHTAALEGDIEMAYILVQTEDENDTDCSHDTLVLFRLK